MNGSFHVTCGNFQPFHRLLQDYDHLRACIIPAKPSPTLTSSPSEVPALNSQICLLSPVILVRSPAETPPAASREHDRCNTPPTTSTAAGRESIAAAVVAVGLDRPKRSAACGERTLGGANRNADTPVLPLLALYRAAKTTASCMAVTGNWFVCTCWRSRALAAGNERLSQYRTPSRDCQDDV